MKKHFTKFTVYSITILTAYLISEYLVNYLNSQYKEKSYISVLIGMVVVLMIYYPVVIFLNKDIQKK